MHAAANDTDSHYAARLAACFRESFSLVAALLAAAALWLRGAARASPAAARETSRGGVLPARLRRGADRGRQRSTSGISRPAGAEPHDLELTPGDVRAVHDASLVFYLGDGFMPGLETAVEAAAAAARSTCSNSCGSRRATAEGRPATPTSGSIRCATPRWCALIGSALGTDASAGRLARRLDAARRASTGAASPTARAARSSRATPPSGISPPATGSSRFRSKGSRRRRSRRPGTSRSSSTSSRASGATTVFFETLVSPKLAETVAREAGVETAVLDPLEGISETRSPPAPTTSPSCVRTSPRCGRRSDARAERPVVELDGVSFGYRAGVRVLEDVSLAVGGGRVRRHRGAERRRQDDAAAARARARAPDRGHGARLRLAEPARGRRRAHRLPPAALAAPRRGAGHRARDRLHRPARPGRHLGPAASRRPRGRGAGDRDGRARQTGPTRRCGRSRAGCSSER